MKFFKVSTIYGRQRSKYMTRVKIGFLRIHIFHRGDEDPDPHDHPFSFWTFPLRSYREQVWPCPKMDGSLEDAPRWRVVKGWRWHYRHSSHVHRVELLGTPTVTICWEINDGSRVRGRWGFYVRQLGSNRRHFKYWERYFD